MPSLRQWSDVREELTEVHAGRYSYEESVFINMNTGVKILCPKHGEFIQTPKKHRRGHGCPMCAAGPNTTTEFVMKAWEVHGLKYDYSESVYIGANDLINIECPTHGKFEQVARTHLSGKGCPACGAARRRKPADAFIREVREVHGNRYDLSKTAYTTCREKVTATCREHGDFSIRPYHLRRGVGCPICAHIERCLENHRDVTISGEFYVAEVTYNGRVCVKVGYTSKSFAERFNDVPDGVQVSSSIIIHAPLRRVIELEKLVLVELRGNRCKWITRRLSGFTECFDVPVDDVLALVGELTNN